MNIVKCHVMAVIQKAKISADCQPLTDPRGRRGTCRAWTAPSALRLQMHKQDAFTHVFTLSVPHQQGKKPAGKGCSFAREQRSHQHPSHSVPGVVSEPLSYGVTDVHKAECI